MTGYDGQNAGIEAAKLASQVKAAQDNLYSNPFKANYQKLIDSTALYYDDDMAEAVVECLQRCESYKMPIGFFPKFWNVLRGIRAVQDQRRVKYSKSDMSSYGFLKGAVDFLGEPVWELSNEWFTYHMDPGGSGCIGGPRGSGKTLLGTQKLSLPYIETYRHVVTGIYADEIYSKVIDNPFNYYHYHSSMNKQLQCAIQIKIDFLQEQMDKPDYIEGKTMLKHPLVLDMIDEASMSRGKHRSMSDKAQQQMYIAGIARHLGIFVWEIHPFDDIMKWVRESLTHMYEFTEQGKMEATIKVAGRKTLKEKKIWGFTSLEKLVEDGLPHIRYRPHAPVSFTVDVDAVAMLDHFNRVFEERLERKEKVPEIQEWQDTLDWLRKDKAAQIDIHSGLTYGNVVFTLAMFYLKLTEYNKNRKGIDNYKPMKITQQLIENIMNDSPFPVKKDALAGDVGRAKRILSTHDFKEMARDEIEKNIYSKLIAQGAQIDSEGNYVKA